jgi:hypothetical protein
MMSTTSMLLRRKADAAIEPPKPSPPPPPKPKRKHRRKHRRGPARGTHHFDKRVDQVLAAEPRPAGPIKDDDDLLTTNEISAWLGVSVSWLEAGREKGYGPPFQRLGPKTIRYPRGACRQYLQSRGQAAMRGEAK